MSDKYEDTVSLNCSVGDVYVPPPSDLSDLECAAIRWRAESGMVPYDVMIKLSPEERERVGKLRQNDAIIKWRKLEQGRAFDIE